MAFSLTWLADVLEDAGLKVAEEPGWRNRGRGEMGQVKGVVCHHTGGAPTGNMPSLGVLKNGRHDLPGPLAQLGLGRDGTFYVVAAGRANHAGGGNWEGISTGNSSFIGIEAENAGTQNDPWPDVQMDAYVRGVAAILKKIGANSIMCCGHREYALPQGRKDDPTFNMFEFRRQVAAVMTGAAPDPKRIPRVDGKGRPTLQRGAKGDLVKLVQAKVNVEQTGNFDAATEAAVRQFQRDNHLVPDGIVGPRTWEALDPIGAAAAIPPAAPKAPAGPIAPAALIPPALPIGQITQIAANSSIASYFWKNRGVAPAGYIKGMALVYARVYCKLKAGDPVAIEMAKAESGDASSDALTWYKQKFAAEDMMNGTDGPDTLRHLFVLLIGLGMRESSGKYCEGRDMSAHNTTADTAEAGLFQTSYNARSANHLLPTLFAHYSANPSGFVDVFKEGVNCTAASLQNQGTGPGRDFQKLSKECPAFAAEFTAVALRHVRGHWGPITNRAAEIRQDCDVMLQAVQDAIEASPGMAAAFL